MKIKYFLPIYMTLLIPRKSLTIKTIILSLLSLQKKSTKDYRINIYTKALPNLSSMQNMLLFLLLPAILGLFNNYVFRGIGDMWHNWL